MLLTHIILVLFNSGNLRDYFVHNVRDNLPKRTNSWPIGS